MLEESQKKEELRKIQEMERQQKIQLEEQEKRKRNEIQKKQEDERRKILAEEERKKEAYRKVQEEQYKAENKTEPEERKFVKKVVVSKKIKHRLKESLVAPRRKAIGQEQIGYIYFRKTPSHSHS